MPAGTAQLTSERGSRDSISNISELRAPLHPGRALGGRYRLERPLGRHGRVWLARDRSGRGFALKTGTDAAIARERRVLEGLRHPHIVRLVDVVDADGAPVLVLEHLAGGDLVSLAGLDPVHWLRPAGELVAALVVLHRAGFVHRDLKARNVMFDASGRTRLIDFGSAAIGGERWTRAGTTAEAVDPGRGEGPVTAADDRFALAVLLHELMHGGPPGSGRARPGPPPALAALVREGLAPGSDSPRPELDRFAAVIKSVLGQT
jgi:serine/threonine protein kinase